MRTVMKNKVFTRLMTALLLAVTVILAAYPSVAYAQVDEKEAAKETVKEEPKKPEITVIKKEEEKEVRYPNKLTAKEPENLKQIMPIRSIPFIMEIVAITKKRINILRMPDSLLLFRPRTERPFISLSIMMNREKMSCFLPKFRKMICSIW